MCISTSKKIARKKKACKLLIWCLKKDIIWKNTAHIMHDSKCEERVCGNVEEIGNCRWITEKYYFLTE